VGGRASAFADQRQTAEFRDLISFAHGQLPQVPGFRSPAGLTLSPAGRPERSDIYPIRCYVRAVSETIWHLAGIRTLSFVIGNGVKIEFKAFARGRNP
jgi:hypothetical protein